MGAVIGIDIGNSGCRISCVNGEGMPIPLLLDEGDVSLRYAVTEETINGENCIFGGDITEDLGYCEVKTLVKPKGTFADKCVSLCRDAEAERAETIFREILSEAIRRTEELLCGERISGAVIACPPYYGASLRRAFKEAAEAVKLSGGNCLNVVGLVDDVNASVLSYLNSTQLDGVKKVLAVDLGASLKASVIDVRPTEKGISIDQCASLGTTAFGGGAFNELLKNYASNAYYDLTGDFLDGVWEDAFESRRLEKQIESAKRRLSKRSTARISVRYDGTKCDVEVQQSEFFKDCEGICLDAVKALEKELIASGVSLSGLDGIFLTGGTASMPIIENVLSKYFGIPVTTFIDDCAVANGAAIMAKALDKKDAALKISQVCPYSIGIRAFCNDEDVISNVVLKNTKLPLSESRTFATVYSDIPKLNLSLYENTSTNDIISVKECDSEESVLSTIMDRGLPRGTVIDVTFTVDENGIFEATVTDRVSNTEKKLV